MKSVICLLLGLTNVAFGGSYESYGGYSGYGSTSSDCDGIRGEMRMFYGRKDYIPKGWQICDGSNYTPDMRGKFAIGANANYPIGSTGGAAGFALNLNQLPSHYHDINANDILVSQEGDHGHLAKAIIVPVGDHKHDEGDLSTKKDYGHSHDFSTSLDAGGHDHRFSLITSLDPGHSHGIDFLSGKDGEHSHPDDFAVEIEGSAHDHDISVTVEPVDNHLHPVNIDDFQVCFPDHKHGVGSYGADDHVFSHGHKVTGDAEVCGLHNHDLDAVVGKAGGHCHDFDFETTENGEHCHDDGTLKTDQAYDHTHSVDEQSTSEDGEHYHNVDGYFEWTYETDGYDDNNLAWDKVDSKKEYPATTGDNGDHIHTVPAHKTNPAGKHDHDIEGDTGSAGAHMHDVTGSITGVDDHCHSIEATSEDDGAHVHKVSGSAKDVTITLEHVMSGYSADAGVYTAGISGVEGETEPAGSHGHKASAETTSDGSHDHELSGEILENGKHDHLVRGDTEPAGKHYHEVKGTIGKTYSYGYGDSPDADGAHSHLISGVTYPDGDHDHDIEGDTGNAGAHEHSLSVTVDNDGKHKHKVSGKTEETGAGAFFPVVPPYQSVYYICYIGVRSSSSSSSASYSYAYGYNSQDSDEDDENSYDKYVGYTPQ